MLVTTVLLSNTLQLYQLAQKQSTMSLPDSGQKKIIKHTDEYRRLVKKAYTKPTTGNESLHHETNNNGIKMIQFVISHGLNVRSKMFPHKDTRKETRYSADGRTASQIDHL